MSRYVAFLRGINLGGRRVKMDALGACFEELGLDGVATFIASGNVVFDHPSDDAGALEERIEGHLEGCLGFPADTFVRPIGELAELGTGDAVRAAEGAGFTPYVTFLKRAPGDEVAEALSGLESPDDRFMVRGREVFWLRRGRLSDSPIDSGDLERAFGGSSTRRKLTTVRRIVTEFGE